MAVIANAALIVLEILGVQKRKGGFELRMFAYYTQLSNFICLISSALFLISRGSTAAVYVRYLACSMLIMTFLVTACILAPFGGGFRKMLFSGNGLYHHTLCPALSVLSYIFWEPHVQPRHVWLLPAMVTLIYGITMMTLNGLGKADGPYPFFRVKNQSRTATALWIIVLFGIISAASILLNILTLCLDGVSL